MDSKKVKAMLTVVGTGSLTAAAKELGYTQPGLTNMMNSLENELGVKILMRSKSGIRLSPAGEYLVEDAEHFVSAADEFERKVEHLRDRNAASLRIGSHSSIARAWLPSIIKSYREENPDADVSAAIYNVHNAYEAVRAGDLDAALVSYHQQMIHGMAWTHLQDDELVAVFPADLVPADGVARAGDFDGPEFLMPSYGFDLEAMPVLERMGARVNNIKYTNMEDSAIISMVAHGLGVSIMSRLIMNGADERVRTVPLSPPRYRELGIIVNETRQNEKRIKSFIEIAENFVIDMAGE